MKKLGSMMLVMAMCAGAIAADHKHPADKCPKGTHTVDRVSKTTTSGAVSGNAGGKVVGGSARGSVSHERTETTRVCRDNKDGKVKERKIRDRIK